MLWHESALAIVFKSRFYVILHHQVMTISLVLLPDK